MTTQKSYWHDVLSNRANQTVVVFIAVVMVIVIVGSLATRGGGSDAFERGRSCGESYSPGQPAYRPGQSQADVIDSCFYIYTEDLGSRSDFEDGVREGYSG